MTTKASKTAKKSTNSTKSKKNAESNELNNSVNIGHAADFITFIKTDEQPISEEKTNEEIIIKDAEPSVTSESSAETSQPLIELADEPQLMEISDGAKFDDVADTDDKTAEEIPNEDDNGLNDLEEVIAEATNSEKEEVEVNKAPTTEKEKKTNVGEQKRTMRWYEARYGRRDYFNG